MTDDLRATAGSTASADLVAWRLQAVAALTVFAIGSLVLLGWPLDVEALRRIVPTPIVMIPNTACAMLLGGSALWALRGRGEKRVMLGRALAVVMVALGTVTFIERTTGWDAGIDLLLFADKVRSYPYRPPGRMATNSTICLSLAGLALVCITGSPRARRIGRTAALLGASISGLALVGYLYGVRPLYAIDQAAGMALITATGFFAMHVGILFIRPSAASLELLFGRGSGGILVRQVLPVALLVIVLLGFLWIHSREAQIVSREGGVALFVLLVCGTIIGLSLRSAKMLRTADAERDALLGHAVAARESAEAANRSKSDFLAIMSHELRTPLNAIIGYSSLLTEGILAPVSEVQLRHLRRIDVNAAHLLGLIEDVLALARPEGDDMSIEPSTFTGDEVVKDVLSVMEPLVAAKRLDLVVHVQDATLPFTSDRRRLRQVLINLLSNAVKFTASGSITLDVRPAGDAVRFTVSDTGIGMTPAECAQAFEPFWRAQQSHARSTEGAGLGLSVTKRITERLGGRISLSSVVDEGTTVEVTIPRSLPQRTMRTPA